MTDQEMLEKVRGGAQGSLRHRPRVLPFPKPRSIRFTGPALVGLWIIDWELLWGCPSVFIR